MKTMTMLLFVLLGVAVADRLPSSYGPPSANGGGNGPSSQYGAPNGNGNGFGGSNGNGFGGSSQQYNGGSNGNGFGAASAQSQQYSAPGQQNGGGSSAYGNGGNGGNGGNRNGNGNGGSSSAYGAPGEDVLLELGENIPGGGVPGEDFPVLSEVPDTGFACEDQEFPGYYADTAPEAGCQVFHICQDRGTRFQIDSFLCPNGTIFNQQYLVCDWWFNFDCSTAEDFYSVNEAIGQEEEGGYGAGSSPAGVQNGNGNGYGNGNGNGNGRPQQNGYGNGNGNGNGNGGSQQNGYSNGGAASQPDTSYSAPSNGRNGGRNGNGNGGSNSYGK